MCLMFPSLILLTSNFATSFSYMMTCQEFCHRDGSDGPCDRGLVLL